MEAHELRHDALLCGSGGRRTGWWPEVGLASYENDGDCCPTNRANLLYPLFAHTQTTAITGIGDRARTFTVTLSSESGVSMAKAMRMT